MTIGRVEPDGRFAPLRLPSLRSHTVAMLVGVGAITMLRLLWLALQPADLFPDEAQYLSLIHISEPTRPY